MKSKKSVFVSATNKRKLKRIKPTSVSDDRVLFAQFLHRHFLLQLHFVRSFATWDGDPVSYKDRSLFRLPASAAGGFTK